MPIQNYMNDIRKIKSLDEDSVLDLFRQYRKNPTWGKGSRQHDQAGRCLRNKLVEQNLKLVFKVASMYRRTGIPFADLVAEGNLGLIRGVEKFDLDKGVKPGYYLFRWIRAMVLRHIVRNAHLVKMGTTQAQRKLFFNLSKTKAKARAQGKELSDDDVAELLGVKVEEVREMEQRLSAPVIRIEASEPDSRKGSYAINRLLQDRIDNTNDIELPDALLEREELSSRVRGVVGSFMSRLSETQRGVFKARFLTENGDPDTFEVIGKRLNGLTKQRVQQIDAELKKKFKKYLTHNQISLGA